MRYLLDSHVYIWLLADSSKVGQKTKKKLQADDSQVALSVASLWELDLKSSKNKLPMSVEQIHRGVQELGVSILNITEEHVKMYNKVKISHTDPFDTMLCAQALSENMLLVTADKLLLEEYPNNLNACE